MLQHMVLKSEANLLELSELLRQQQQRYFQQHPLHRHQQQWQAVSGGDAVEAAFTAEPTGPVLVCLRTPGSGLELAARSHVVLLHIIV